MPKIESVEILNDGYITVRGDGLPARFPLLGTVDYNITQTGNLSITGNLAVTGEGTLAFTKTYATGSSTIYVIDTYTQIAAVAHKSIRSELTYAPATAGTACPIAIVGKLTLNGDLDADTNTYPGMGWGIQGQVHVATGTTINGSTYGDPGAIYAGVRGVVTDAGTSTYTKGILTCFFGDMQLTQNASSNANFKVYGMYLYLYQAVSNTNVDALLALDKHASVTASTIEKGIYIRCGMTTAIDIDPQAGAITTGIDLGTIATPITFTGTITGNGIDFSNITMVPTGSGGPCLIRAGVYGSPATSTFVEDSSDAQSGMIRLYGATSGDASYARGVFVCLVTTGQKGIMPVAGLAEIRDDATGPTNVKACEFIVDLHTTGANLATNGKIYAGWFKITGKDGCTVSSTGTRAAAVWLDNQMYGANWSTNIVEEYTIFSTTGGAKPLAWAGFETTASGWTNFLSFDETSYDQDPVVSADLTGSTKKYLKVNFNGTAYGIHLWSVA